MDVIKAKEICADFRPIETEGGKKKCRFSAEGSICKRPEYFRCELKLYQEKEQRNQITHQIISPTQVGTILRCPRLYALQKVYRVDPPLPATWKIVGRTFSDASAKIDLGLKYQLTGDINSYPVAKAKLSAILRRYQEWKKDWGPLMSEVRVSFQYKDVFFLGFLDRLTKDRKTIIEWKYAGTKYDELKIIWQAATYFKGVPEAEKLVLAVANKPKHKLLKAKKPTKKEPDPHDETPRELEERIYKELEGKEHNTFTYWNYDREFFDVDGMLEQIYQASRLIKAYEKSGFPPAFGMGCDGCDYRPYCLKHLVQIGCTDKRCTHKQLCATIRKIRDGQEKVKRLPENLEYGNQAAGE